VRDVGAVAGYLPDGSPMLLWGEDARSWGSSDIEVLSPP